MALVASLVGVIVFVRKRSLLGEALSHATYPGVTGAVLFAGVFSLGAYAPALILIGAALTALLGYFLIDTMERKLGVTNDAALCCVLSLFFGVGITVASYAQNAYTALFRQIQVYLYGQSATMTDIHIALYGGLTLLVVATILLFYKEILALSFDRPFAEASGIASRVVPPLLTLLVVIAVVMGIRSVGVILMSALLIAPATAARQFTNRLSRLFVLAALFGMFSAFLGTYLSVVISGMPTGPMIVLVAGGIAFYALLFAPERGLLIRYWRAARFRSLQMEENLLKFLWREVEPINFQSLANGQGLSTTRIRYLLSRLRMRGWVKREGGVYRLTPAGRKRGGQIIRLHRLWEAYLVHAMGLGVERVHKSAEEMEHILTPELERKLTKLLDDPKHDPHAQPIPTFEEVMSHG